MRVLAAVAAFTGVALVVPIAGRWRFDWLVDRDTRRLFSSGSAGVGPDQQRARWNTLPDPVRRYLRFAVREGTPETRTARLQHDGLFRTKPSQRWLPIKGEQSFTTAIAGFVWHATVRLLPFVWIEARDCLMGGRGQMLVKLQSVEVSWELPNGAFSYARFHVTRIEYNVSNRF